MAGSAALRLWPLARLLLLAFCAVTLGWLLARQPVAPADADAERLERLAQRLERLHQPMPAPRPGEWLSEHTEAGQTFAQYCASTANRPTAQRRVLYVQPLGPLDAQQQRLMQTAGEALELFYQLPVRWLPPIGLDRLPSDAQRQAGVGGRQINSIAVLEMLKPLRPNDAVAVLALTATDLWPGDGWNFVFGQASLADRVGVWSVARLCEPSTPATLATKRTVGVAVHETGHMLGMPHCTAWRCVMNGSNHLAESDAQPLYACPQCVAKVWWASGCDPQARAKALADFAQAQGFAEAAAYWTAQQRVLENSHDE